MFSSGGMNNMLALQQCMGDAGTEASSVGLQSVLSSQQEFHVEPHKNLPLALNGEVPHVIHNAHLQLHPSSHLHCVPPPQQPLMGSEDTSRNSLVYYSNQPQVNVAHESPSHVSCDSPSHLAYNPMGHMSHNMPLHVAHNSPNHMSHGSPVHWQHGSPVPMPCNSPGNVPCQGNNLHLAHSSPGHGSCNSPVHMSCNSGLHLPHNSPVHMSQGSPSPQSASHGQASTVSDTTQNGGVFMAAVPERCKFCGVELPMDTLAVVAHFNSHWRQPETDASACSYVAMNSRAPNNPQFNIMHKYNVNNRFMNSIPPGDDPTSGGGEPHHSYAASFPYSTPGEAGGMPAADHGLKLYDLPREGTGQMVLQSTMHPQEGSSGPAMSSTPKVLSNGESPHNRCSPLNLTGRSKLSASPLQQPPTLEGRGCAPSIENSIYMQGPPNDIAVSVLHTSQPQLLNSNAMSNGAPYQTMYTTPGPFFGSSCPYNGSVSLPPQSLSCKVQQTFSHNLDSVGLSIPVLSPNLASTEEENGACIRREGSSEVAGDERSSTVLGTSDCMAVSQHADHTVSQHADHTVSQHTDHTVSQHTDHTVSQHADHTVSQHTDHTVSQHTDHTVSQHADHTVSQHADHTVSQHADHTVSQHADHTVSHLTGHVISHPIDPRVSHPADLPLSNNVSCTDETSSGLGDRHTCISRFKSCDGNTDKSPPTDNIPARAGHVTNEGLEKPPESEASVYPTDSSAGTSATGDSSISCSASATLVVSSSCSDVSLKPDMLSKPPTTAVGLCGQYPLSNFLSNPVPLSPTSYPLHSMALNQPTFSSDQSLVSATPHTYPANFISISSHFNSAANTNLMSAPSINPPPNSSVPASVPETATALQPPSLTAVCSPSSVFANQHSTSVIVPQPPPLVVSTSSAVTASASAAKPYKCSVCNEEFNLKEDLKAHFLAHEAAKPFHCDVCGLGVCNQKALKRHKLTHTGLKPYKCDTCGRCFLQKHDLNRHMTIHDRPKYLTCEQCKRTFTGLSPFKSHKCKGAKVGMPYLCHICGDGCANRLSWSYHMWKHTKNPMFVPFQENVSPLES